MNGDVLVSLNGVQMKVFVTQHCYL